MFVAVRINAYRRHQGHVLVHVNAVDLDHQQPEAVSAFRLFEKAQAAYVDLFGRLEIKSYRSAESNPAFWASAVFDLLKSSERKGPYFFLFDDEQLMTSADYVLPDIILPIVGKAARFVMIRHAGAPSLGG
jgi:hypothetical protein